MSSSVKAIPAGDVEVGFHGDLIMYRHDRMCKGRFTEGRVQWIQRIDTH